MRIEVCTQRVALNPNDFETYQFRARAKNYLCDYLGAIEDYKQAIIALKENDNDSNTALFILYSELLHIKKHIHNWQGVIDVYTELIKLNVFESHYFYCERAQVKYDLGYYLGAIEDCTQIINSKSDITRAYFIRASAKKCLGNYQEALDDCDLAIYRCKGECEYLTRLLTLRNQIV